MAKMRLNDKILTLQPVSGKLVDNTNVFTQVVVNTAWRVTQERLGDKGYDRLIDEVIIKAFPIVASTDPATQCWLNWTGCFDGANFYQQPCLPAYFNHPLKIWERWSNHNFEFYDPPMTKMLNGLPSLIKSPNLRYWEWRNDTLYFIGSQNVEDLRIRHIRFLPDFLDVGSKPWFQQLVPIMRVADALAWFICAEIAVSRGDNALADVYTGNGDGALDRIFNLDVEADQMVNVRRRPRTGYRRGGW